MINQQARLAEEKAAQTDAAHGKRRDQQLAAKKRRDRDQTVEQRHADVLQRVGRQVSDQRGHQKFRQFHLPKLALAEQAEKQQQTKIQDQGSDKNNCQADITPAISISQAGSNTRKEEDQL